MKTIQKNQLLFLVYFFLSSLFTWWFIILSPMYISTNQMLFSTFIAGGKWALQIILGFILLKEKSWEFLKGIGKVCFIGSSILLPFVLSSFFEINNNSNFFFSSLIVAVLVMIIKYFQVIKHLKININWWFFWMFCLIIAITMQLTFVFHFL